MPRSRDRSHFCASELNVHGLSVLASLIKNPDTEVRQYVLDNVRDLTGIDLLDSKTMSHLTPDQVTMLKHYEFEHVNELVEDLADIQVKDRMGATGIHQAMHHHKSRRPTQRDEIQPVTLSKQQPKSPTPPPVIDDDLPEDEWDEPLDEEVDLDDHSSEPEEEELQSEEDTIDPQQEDVSDELRNEIYDHFEPEESVPVSTSVSEEEKHAPKKVTKSKPLSPKVDKNRNGIPDEDEMTYTSSSNRSASALFWFGVFITVVTMAYLFMVTWLPIPANNVRFADMASGFILGILTTVLGFFFGSSMQRTDFHSVVQKTRGGASFQALNNNLQNTRNMEQNTFGNNFGCPPQK